MPVSGRDHPSEASTSTDVAGIHELLWWRPPTLERPRPRFSTAGWISPVAASHRFSERAQVVVLWSVQAVILVQVAEEEGCGKDHSPASCRNLQLCQPTHVLRHLGRVRER